MRKENLYLVLDQGGHATRAVVFDESANLISHYTAEIRTLAKGELIVEHDPLELIESFTKVLQSVAQEFKNKSVKFLAAGLATQRSSIVCWDKNTGKVISNVISWQDRRTSEDIEQFKHSRELIHHKTGLYLNPHYGATKMRWCIDHLPALRVESFGKNICIAPIASYILFSILKERPFVVDPANASRTLLMNYREMQWDSELLSLFSIPREVLPKIVPTTHHFGTLRFGEYQVPMSVCNGDQSSAIFAKGELDSEVIYINAGTGAFVQRYVEQSVNPASEKLLSSVVAHSDNKTWYVLEGTVNGAGRALQWYAEQTELKNYENLIDQWSRETTEPPIFLNGISGIGSPFWKPVFTSRFINEKNVQENFVAILESIVFLMNVNIKKLVKLSGPVSKLIISGGLSKSQMLCQKLADLSQIEVICDEASEATSIGTFQLLTEFAVTQKFSAEQSFRPNENSSLHARYLNWLNLMKAATA